MFTKEITKNWATLIIIAIFAIVVPDILLACPNCKSGFTESTQQAMVGQAFSFSVLKMILLPVTIIGVLAFVIVRQAKKNAVMSGTKTDVGSPSEVVAKAEKAEV